MLGLVRRSLLALLFSVGCAARQAPDPAQTTADLVAALRAGDADALAALTARSRDAIVAAQAANVTELRALGETLAHAPTERAARAWLSDGGAVSLVHEDGSWRVDRGVLGRPVLARPEDAVVALHDALVRSRLGALTTLLARSPRAELEGELARWIDGTADPDALEVSVHGEAAMVLTPTGDHIELVHEGGEWRVVDVR
jgi:hypothetical protein